LLKYFCLVPSWAAPFIDESFGFLGNNLLLGMLNELTTTVTAFMILLAVMDTTIFDDFD
jgi:hypothetical protein